MNTLLHLTAVLASLWASIFAFQGLEEPALGGAMLVLFFGFVVMTVAALDDDLFLITGRKLLGFRGSHRQGISTTSRVAIGAAIVFLFLSTIAAIGVVTLLSPGSDGDSTTTSSPSGLELISKSLTVIRGCADQELIQWTESTDLWGCSNTLTSPDINGGTWNGTIDGASTATSSLTFNDDIIAALGAGGDTAFVLNSAGLAANTELPDAIVGTSVYANAIPANSAIISNITADGDIVFFTNTGGNSIEAMRIDASARSLVLPFVNDATTPTLAFGTGTTGVYLSTESPDNLSVSIAGTLRWVFDASGFFLAPALGGGGLRGSGGNATTPGAFPDRTDIDTGMGRGAANQLSLIAGGNEGIRIIGAGDIDLTPTANTDASASPILIQNVSQTTTPGTTVNGQIRLWQDSDVGGVDGRIVFQVNGTTFQVNADAGLTFTNNPLVLARDKALFTAGHAQWKLDRVDEADDEFVAFSATHTKLALTRIPPTWSTGYLNHLRAQYAVADAALNSDDNVEQGDIPYVPTIAEMEAENPWPDPATYTIAGATSDETVSFRTSTQFDVGDPLVMVVDRKKFNAAAGENWDVHAVPSTLTDEFIWLLQNDATFLNDVKMLLGL